MANDEGSTRARRVACGCSGGALKHVALRGAEGR